MTSVDDRMEVPVVHVLEDLVGKRVMHLCVNEDDVDEGNESSSGWYEGCVLSLCGRGKNPLFQIRYDGFDDIWTFRLMKHLQDGVLKLVPNKRRSARCKYSAQTESGDLGRMV